MEYSGFPPFPVESPSPCLRSVASPSFPPSFSFRVPMPGSLFFHFIFPFRARAYIIMCPAFPLPFPSLIFMFYNMFHNQPFTVFFSYS